jgi:type IV secretory pathway VirB3-like protein
LKKVEIVIIKNIRRGILKEKVLKALANPPRIFYVPYSLAMLNFFFWFLLFIILMVIFLIFSGNIPMWLPLCFLGSLIISHMILGIFSRKDSQIAQIILSNFVLFKNKIPRKLVS